MKKYLMVARLSFQEDLFYRANFFFYFLDQSALFLVQLLLWSAVFRETGSVAGFDFSGILQYFVVVRLVQLFTVSRIGHTLSDKIRSGGLSRFLLQPWSFFLAMFFRQLGKRTYRLIYLMVVIGILNFSGLIELSLSRLLIFLLMLLNVSILSFLYRFAFGTFAFWFTNVSSIIWFFQQSIDFLGGGWLPASFFPGGAANLIKKLPFYLTLGFPAEVFQDKIVGSAIAVGIVQQLVWIFIFTFLTLFLWRKGIKKYEAVGN